MTRGAEVIEFRPEELSPEEAARVYMKVLTGKPRMIRKRFDVADDSRFEDYVRMASDHPMIRIGSVFEET